MKKPAFDKAGYQVNLEDLNGEALPDLSKVKIISREKAGLPSAADVRTALATLKPSKPTSYAKARQNAGLTQGEFAKALHVPLGTYRQWEQGRRAPSGPAKALMLIVSRHPDLIEDLSPSVKRALKKRAVWH